jgi:hypothetical protein
MGTALSHRNGTLSRTESLTYAIYWSPKVMPDALANGHASVIIDSAKFSQYLTAPGLQVQWYVSWYADGSKPGSLGLCGDFLKEGDSWKGAKASPTSDILLPTRWVALKGLDIDAMKAAWEQIRNKQNAHWKLLSKNCATVAARVLKAGGGDDHATSSKNQLVWWPTDVIRYAKSMKGLVQFTSSDPPGAGE